MKFGLLANRTRNLGDDIQALAARQYLPRIDERLDREELAAADHCGETFLFANGWFLDEPSHWPPAANLQPFFIGFHIADPNLATPELATYYRRFAPIGCRDTQTVELLRQIGIEAYFSGCLTLSLERPGIERTQEVVVCDVDDGLLPPEISARGVRVSHWLEPPLRYQLAGRLAKAEQFLWLYARAELVVTGRLHATLPCLAFGTPVVYARDPLGLASDRRLGGLGHMIRPASSREEVLREAARASDARSPEVQALASWQQATCRQAVTIQGNPLR